MASVAERMKALRARRRSDGLREVRIQAPDVRSAHFRSLVAQQVAALDPADEERALRWIEAVAEFEVDAPG